MKSVRDIEPDDQEEDEMLLMTSDVTTETTISLMDSLVKQLATIKFEGALFLVVLTLASVYICLEGYGIYRMALSVIGFAVGYSHARQILDILHIQIADGSSVIIQVIIGLICAGLAYSVLKIGIFIAAYHFVQVNFSAMLVAALAERISIPEAVYPIFAAVAGVVIAFLIAKLAVKSERLVIVALTAAVGGFAAVGFFREMIPVFPVNINFMQRIPEVIWLGAKIFLSAAGFMVQGPTKE